MMEKIIKCTCGTELLQMDFDKEYKQLYMAVFKFGGGRPGWLNQLRMIWDIIWNGNPYHDQLVWDEVQVDEALEFLTEVSKECKKDKILDTLQERHDQLVEEGKLPAIPAAPVLPELPEVVDGCTYTYKTFLTTVPTIKTKPVGKKKIKKKK